MRGLIFTLLLISTLASAAGDQPEVATTIDRWIRQEVIVERRLPGLALAVVTRDGTILVSGYGNANDAGATVDADTYFYIASATKSYLGMLAAKLADEGRIDLDRGFGHYLPGARLPDALDAREISVESLLTHSMGFENDAVVYRTAFSGNHDPDTLLGLLPLSEVREGDHFEYDNVGYVIFSWILENQNGGSWKDMLRSELLLPAGMRDTSARISTLERSRLAMPMADAEDGGFAPMPLAKTDETLHAAGGLFTTAMDLARWLELNLTHGSVGDRRVVSDKAVLSAHRARVSQDNEFFDYHRTGYALGWNTGEYDGEAFVHHFGSFPGYRSHVSFMPEHGIGVAVVTNTTGARFFMVDLIASFVYQTLLDRPNVQDRFAQQLEEMDEAVTERVKRIAEHRREIEQREWQLSKPMGNYAGTYTSMELGTLTITRDANGLLVTHGQLSAHAQPYPKQDVIRLELVPNNGHGAAFAIDNGVVTGLHYLGVEWSRLD